MDEEKVNINEICKNLLDSLEEQCWTMLDEETYGYVNKAHAEFMGKRQEEVSFKKIRDVLIEPELTFCQTSTREAFVKGEKIVGEYWIKNAKDEMRLLKFEKTPYIENDEIKYVLCKCKDITKTFNRKLITKEQYKDVVEAQPYLVFRFKPDFNITFLNSTYCKNFGIDCKKKLVGKNFLDHVPEKEHQTLKDYFADFTQDKPIKSHYHSLLHKNNSTFVQWFDRAFFNERGHIMEFQSIGVVMPDIKKLEEKLIREHKENISKINRSLIESNQRYETLLEAVPDSVFLHNNHNILFANKELANLLDVDEPEQLIGQKIECYLCEGEVKKAKHYIEELHKGKRFPLIEFKIKTAKGRVLYVEIASTITNYRGERCILNIIRDITERKKHEELKKIIEEEEKLLLQAQEHDRLRTEFFANISHELRTPLNIILSTIQLLEFQHRQKNAGKDFKYFTILKHNCFRLLRLINNLIDITKIDSGYADTNLGNYDIIKLVTDLLETASPYIQSKELALDYQTEVDKKIIACDPEMIERVLLNLISNAVKFTQPGGQIAVMVGETADELCITVEDTGIGIAPENQDVIFERFHQIDKSFTRSQEGSGIGLALTKALVEMHHGKIQLKSQVGKGSKFTIGLPNTRINKSDHEEIYTKSHSMEKINIEFSDIQ